jgi:AraC-like DNA-binding protein
MDDRALVAAMVAYMEQHLIEPITAEALAMRAGYSLNRFRQRFFNVTGETPSAYLRKRRLTEAAKAILAGDRIADVALTYGYSSQDNFTTAFRSYFGVTPTEIGRIEGKYRRFIRRLREAYSIMEIANLKQPPLCTTLMGCVKGASDCFDNDLSTSMLFGLTGHAFLLNIHTELCPSSPYVWNKDRFFDLLAKIGIRRTAEVERHIDTPPEQVARIEATLREALDAGQLCMLDFLEHQLVSGYDENGLIMLQPWNGNASSEVPAISFGTWNECLEKEGWAHLTVLRREEQQAPVREVARAGTRPGSAPSNADWVRDTDTGGTRKSGPNAGRTPLRSSSNWPSSRTMARGRHG